MINMYQILMHWKIEMVYTVFKKSSFFFKKKVLHTVCILELKYTVSQIQLQTILIIMSAVGLTIHVNP